MSTIRKSLVVRAAKAAVSALRAPLLGDSPAARRIMLCEPLEERLLFTTYTGEYWIYNPYSATGYCGPFYITSQRYTSTDCQGNTSVIQYDAHMPDTFGWPIKWGPVTESPNPVQYDNGQPITFTTDVASDGYGKKWSQTRSWNVAIGNGPLGPGWDISDWTHLVDIKQNNQTDNDAPPNATNYFQYNSSNQVSSETAQGAGC